MPDVFNYIWRLFCEPGGIQTRDLQNRNLTLYSAKLRVRRKYQVQR